MKALGHIKIETEQEEDGRWIAELPDLPGAMAYGDTRENAVANVQALAFRIAADKIEAHDRTPEIALFTVIFA
jgi:predicted RNase H-like HicB family nuclease